jgi:acyl-CoA synthetase (AMP-forming)/AMP-acid ligase II
MIYVDSLGRAARYFPELTALAVNGKRSTFRELHARVGRIAAALTKHGFKTGHRLAILLPNEPDYIQLVYACAWLGVTAVPLNTRSQRNRWHPHRCATARINSPFSAAGSDRAGFMATCA